MLCEKCGKWGAAWTFSKISLEQTALATKIWLFSNHWFSSPGREGNIWATIWDILETTSKLCHIIQRNMQPRHLFWPTECEPTRYNRWLKFTCATGLTLFSFCHHPEKNRSVSPRVPQRGWWTCGTEPPQSNQLTSANLRMHKPNQISRVNKLSPISSNQWSMVRHDSWISI